MRFGSDLQAKALLALEEICADCRYREPPRTYAVRLALAYLWSLSGGSSDPFLEFWRELANDNQLFRWKQTDNALTHIYAAVGADRDGQLSWHAWRLAQDAHEKRMGRP
jgi:hypothetical protein